MYEKHFGLAKPPFKITPDPDFFFPGGNRGAVLEALVYAVLRGEGIITAPFVGDGHRHVFVCHCFLAVPRVVFVQFVHCSRAVAHPQHDA